MDEQNVHGRVRAHWAGWSTRRNRCAALAIGFPETWLPAPPRGRPGARLAASRARSMPSSGGTARDRDPSQSMSWRALGCPLSWTTGLGPTPKDNPVFPPRGPTQTVGPQLRCTPAVVMSPGASLAATRVQRCPSGAWWPPWEAPQLSGGSSRSATTSDSMVSDFESSTARQSGRVEGLCTPRRPRRVASAPWSPTYYAGSPHGLVGRRPGSLSPAEGRLENGPGCVGLARRVARSRNAAPATGREGNADLPSLPADGPEDA